MVSIKIFLDNFTCIHNAYWPVSAPSSLSFPYHLGFPLPFPFNSFSQLPSASFKTDFLPEFLVPSPPLIIKKYKIRVKKNVHVLTFLSVNSTAQSLSMRFIEEGADLEDSPTRPLCSPHLVAPCWWPQSQTVPSLPSYLLHLIFSQFTRIWVYNQLILCRKTH